MNRTNRSVKIHSARETSPTLIQPEWNLLYKNSVPRPLKKYELSVAPPKSKSRKKKKRAKDDFNLAVAKKRKPLKKLNSETKLSKSYHQTIPDRDAIFSALEASFNVVTD